MNSTRSSKRARNAASTPAAEKTPHGPSITCPGCGKPALYSASNPCRPFCSERCRLLDLGAWARESYRIPDNTPADGTLTDDAN